RPPSKKTKEPQRRLEGKTAKRWERKQWGWRSPRKPVATDRGPARVVVDVANRWMVLRYCSLVRPGEVYDALSAASRASGGDRGDGVGPTTRGHSPRRGIVLGAPGSCRSGRALPGRLRVLAWDDGVCTSGHPSEAGGFPALPRHPGGGRGGPDG